MAENNNFRAQLLSFDDEEGHGCFVVVGGVSLMMVGSWRWQ